MKEGRPLPQHLGCHRIIDLKGDPTIMLHEGPSLLSEDRR